KLHDRVFDILGLAAQVERDAKFDERWKKVTILHLLHHTGGWDRAKSFDPMFRSPAIVEELKTKPPAGPNDIIRYMLRQPLHGDSRSRSRQAGAAPLRRVVSRSDGQSWRLDRVGRRSGALRRGVQRAGEVQDPRCQEHRDDVRSAAGNGRS